MPFKVYGDEAETTALTTGEGRKPGWMQEHQNERTQKQDRADSTDMPDGLDVSPVAAASTLTYMSSPPLDVLIGGDLDRVLRLSVR
jgi:hypothetical protein